MFYLKIFPFAVNGTVIFVVGGDPYDGGEDSSPEVELIYLEQEVEVKVEVTNKACRSVPDLPEPFVSGLGEFVDGKPIVCGGNLRNR